MKTSDRVIYRFVSGRVSEEFRVEWYNNAMCIIHRDGFTWMYVNKSGPEVVISIRFDRPYVFTLSDPRFFDKVGGMIDGLANYRLFRSGP